MARNGSSTTPGRGSAGQSGSSDGSLQEQEELRIGWRMAGLGFQVATEVAAGALLGWLFDRYSGTAPTGLLTGAIIGIAVGMWSLVRGALAVNKRLTEQSARTGRRIPPVPPPTDEPDDNGFWPDDDHLDRPARDA